MLAVQKLAQEVHDVDVLRELISRATVVLLGGLGIGEWGRALFDEVLSGTIPLVIDADGLNLLAQIPQKRVDWVLTPHQEKPRDYFVEGISRRIDQQLLEN